MISPLRFRAPAFPAPAFPATILRGLLLLALLGTGVPSAAGHPLELSPPLHAALESLRNGHYGQALQQVRALRQALPDHPLPPLIAAEASWGLIFCETGHINSREIWNVTEAKSSPRDEEFSRAVAEALEASEALREQPGSAALGAFYEGLAHGVRARLYTLRSEALNSGRAGKQMREALLNAVAEDPSLQPDAAAGLGAYNYYADVLSPLIKLFRFFLLIPGGDRETGLEQLRMAAEQAVLLAPEASYELAKIFAIRENRPEEALDLFARLARRYPGNAFYSLYAALQAERLGKTSLAAAHARQAINAAETMDAVCRDRLEPAAAQALSRLQDAARP